MCFMLFAIRPRLVPLPGTAAPGWRSGSWSMQITADQIQLKTMHQILYLLSISPISVFFFLFKNKPLLLIQL